MLKIALFSTFRDEAAWKLFKIIHSLTKTHGVEIPFIFCNRTNGENDFTTGLLSRLKKHNIPIITLSSKSFLPELRATNLKKWRMLYDEEIHKRIKKYKIDIIFLCGYMLILSKVLYSRYDIINLHPALPNGPKGSWQEVIKEIIRRKEKKHGLMIHIVTGRLDRGPVITYSSFPVKKYDFWYLRREGVKRELKLVKNTLILLASGKIKIKNKKVYCDSEYKPSGYYIKL